MSDDEFAEGVVWVMVEVCVCVCVLDATAMIRAAEGPEERGKCHDLLAVLGGVRRVVAGEGGGGCGGQAARDYTEPVEAASRFLLKGDILGLREYHDDVVGLGDLEQTDVLDVLGA